MDSQADDAQARREAYWARRQAASRRTVTKVYIGMAVIWVVLATVRWFEDDADMLMNWLFTGLAVGWVGLACTHWWKYLRRPPS
jgi:hypothetical protein